MEPSVTLELELTVTKGRVMYQLTKTCQKMLLLVVIPIDAIYTPIKRLPTK